MVMVLVVSGSVALFMRESDRDRDRKQTQTTTTGAPAPQRQTFEDDFSEPAGGWIMDTFAVYGAGTYRLRLPGGPSRRVAAAPVRNAIVAAMTLSGADTRLEVDVDFAPPNTDGGAGLYCRSQAETRYRYQAVILAGGGWEITKEGMDVPTTRLASGPSIPPRIGVANRVRFECRSAGSATTLRLEVGGALIGEAVDENGLQGGTFGVVVTSLRAPGVEGVFDNFSATSLQG